VIPALTLTLGLAFAQDPAPAAAPASPDAAQDEPGAPVQATAKGLDPSEIVGSPEGRPLTGAELEDRTRDVASKLRCPTCQGMSVAESPAEGARAMKKEVGKLLAAGYSDSQVLDFFEASYGEFILLQPRQRGANLALWWGPAGAAVVGGLLIAARVLGKRSSSAPPPPPPAAPPGADPYLDRVRREIDA
jgi:cytochrome c-type biogenesis protein CcmH